MQVIQAKAIVLISFPDWSIELRTPKKFVETQFEQGLQTLNGPRFCKTDFAYFCHRADVSKLLNPDDALSEMLKSLNAAGLVSPSVIKCIVLESDDLLYQSVFS